MVIGMGEWSLDQWDALGLNSQNDDDFTGAIHHLASQSMGKTWRDGHQATRMGMDTSIPSHLILLWMVKNRWHTSPKYPMIDQSIVTSS